MAPERMDRSPTVYLGISLSFATLGERGNDYADAGKRQSKRNRGTTCISTRQRSRGKYEDRLLIVARHGGFGIPCGTCEQPRAGAPPC
jgi:hypothetical protein